MTSDRRAFINTVGITTALTVTAGCLASLPGQTGGEDVDVSIETTEDVDSIGTFEPETVGIEEDSEGRKLVATIRARIDDELGEYEDCVVVQASGEARDGDGEVVDAYDPVAYPFPTGETEFYSVYDDGIDSITSITVKLSVPDDQSKCDQ